MMKKLLSLITVLTLCFCSSSLVFAANDPVKFNDSIGTLTQTEATEINKKLNELSEAYNVEIVIDIVDTTEGLDIETFAEKFYDAKGYGYGASRDGVMLLVAMGDRELIVYSTGLGMKALSLDEIDYLTDDIASYLTNGDYVSAYNSYINECRYQIDGEINGFPFDFGFTCIISLGAGVVVAFIVTGIMKGKLKTVRGQANATQYTKKGSMKITQSNDVFLYNRIYTKRRETKESSNRSSSSSHHSVSKKF